MAGSTIQLFPVRTYYFRPIAYPRRLRLSRSHLVLSALCTGNCTAFAARFRLGLLALANKKETFTERFNRLTAHLSDAELAVALGLSVSAARMLRSGETRSLKFAPAMRLCKRLGISPWELAGIPEP